MNHDSFDMVRSDELIQYTGFSFPQIIGVTHLYIILSSFIIKIY